MVEKITSDICVRVTPIYQPQLSDINKNHFVFSYNIEVQNLSSEPVQLISRHWEIIDTKLHEQIVDGAGVVGKTPILAAGKSFCYTSAVSIESETGIMGGYYLMKNLVSNKEFKVLIPNFTLIVPYLLN